MSKHKNSFDDIRFYLRLSAFVLVALFAQACGDTMQRTTNTYVKAKPVADETSVVMALKTIATAQQNYLLTHGGKDYGTFDQLVEAGSLDERFKGDAPNLHGYVFSMKVIASKEGQEPAFSANADPQATTSRPVTGSRHFYIDSSSGVVHFNDNQQATSSDAPTQ